jgi:hypothetical protein
MVEFVSGQQKHPEISFRRPQQTVRNLKKSLGNAKQLKLNKSDSLVVSVPLLVRKKETLKPSKGLTDNYRSNRSGCQTARAPQRPENPPQRKRGTRSAANGMRMRS